MGATSAAGKCPRGEQTAAASPPLPPGSSAKPQPCTPGLRRRAARSNLRSLEWICERSENRQPSERWPPCRTAPLPSSGTVPSSPRSQLSPHRQFHAATRPRAAGAEGWGAVLRQPAPGMLPFAGAGCVPRLACPPTRRRHRSSGALLVQRGPRSGGGVRGRATVANSSRNHPLPRRRKRVASPWSSKVAPIPPYCPPVVSSAQGGDGGKEAVKKGALPKCPLTPGAFWPPLTPAPPSPRSRRPACSTQGWRGAGFVRQAGAVRPAAA